MEQDENKIRDRIAKTIKLKESNNTVNRLANYELFAAFVINQPRRRTALVSKQTMKTLCEIIIPAKVGITIADNGKIYVFDNRLNPEDKLDLIFDDHNHAIDIHYITEGASILMVSKNHDESGKKASFYDLINMKFLYTMDCAKLKRAKFTKNGNYFMYVDTNKNSGVFDVRNRCVVKGSIQSHSEISDIDMRNLVTNIYETESGKLLLIRGTYTCLHVNEINVANGNIICRGFKIGSRENTRIVTTFITEDGKVLILMTRAGKVWEAFKVDLFTGVVKGLHGDTIGMDLMNEAYTEHEIILTNDREFILMVHYSHPDGHTHFSFHDYKTGCMVKHFDYKHWVDSLFVVNNVTNIARQKELLYDDFLVDLYKFVVFYTFGHDEKLVEDFLIIPSHLEDATYVFERL